MCNACSLTPLNCDHAVQWMCASQIVHQHFINGKPAADACSFIMLKAAAAWREFEGNYRDDITVVVAYLNPLVRSLQLELEVEHEESTVSVPGEGFLQKENEK